jgi:hypothetical protein
MWWKSWVRCVTGEIVGLVPHRKLILREHNIKVRAVLTHRAGLLGWVRPMFLLLWTPLDLGLLRHRHVGINSQTGFRYAVQHFSHVVGSSPTPMVFLSLSPGELRWSRRPPRRVPRLLCEQKGKWSRHTHWQFDRVRRPHVCTCGVRRSFVVLYSRPVAS